MAEKNKEKAEDKLRNLAKRIDELESKLRKESILLEEVLRELRLLKDISLTSAFILRTASKIKGYKYDDISRHIIEALMRSGPMNISQLTRLLREIRGTASRRIISEKIKLLRSLGLIEEVPGKKSEKRYKIKRDNRYGKC